jgi:hypothetical protein
MPPDYVVCARQAYVFDIAHSPVLGDRQWQRPEILLIGGTLTPLPSCKVKTPADWATSCRVAHQLRRPSMLGGDVHKGLWSANKMAYLPSQHRFR